jgi:hypothetical protein
MSEVRWDRFQVVIARQNGIDLSGGAYLEYFSWQFKQLFADIPNQGRPLSINIFWK